jgi:hypothetical protein
LNFSGLSRCRMVILVGMLFADHHMAFRSRLSPSCTASEQAAEDKTRTYIGHQMPAVQTSRLRIFSHDNKHQDSVSLVCLELLPAVQDATLIEQTADQAHCLSCCAAQVVLL